MHLQCRACGATYVDVLEDGTQYFHACAPLSVFELREALAAGTVQLAPQQAKQLEVLDAQLTAIDASPGSPPPGDAYLAQLVVERPNKRDENVVVTGKDDTGRSIVRAKLEGAGVLGLA